VLVDPVEHEGTKKSVVAPPGVLGVASFSTVGTRSAAATTLGGVTAFRLPSAASVAATEAQRVAFCTA
jgi:hypothetical protein